MSQPIATSVLAALAQPVTGALEAAIAQRHEIFQKTQIAEDAVLRPKSAGGLSHDLRAALAARIALANNDLEEAARFRAMVHAPEVLALADLSVTSDDVWTQAIVEFTDQVASNPRDMEADDITRLQGAGVSDADIVRAAELNAFLAYHLRLVAGLRLLSGDFK